MPDNKVYVTRYMSDRFPQLSFEQIMYAESDNDIPDAINIDPTATRTILTSHPPPFNVSNAMIHLINFKALHQELFEANRESLYYSFSIPKKSGGLRNINAPEPPLMNALRELQNMLTQVFGYLYHTNAYAYITGRTPRMSLKKHAYNSSDIFVSFDFSNFFGSTTLEFLLSQLKCIYPYNYMFDSQESIRLLASTLELCFLNGGLPQGTPISPFLTNLMMLPIDFELTKILRPRHVYTRYADDILISSRADFDAVDIQENVIINTLSKFNAPFKLNPEKTRKVNRAGPNFHLGLLINQSNDITIGHKKKHQFKAMLFSLMMDRKNHKHWCLHDLQTLQGYINYYRMVEPEIINSIIDTYSKNFNYDIERYIKEEIASSAA